MAEVEGRLPAERRSSSLGSKSSLPAAKVVFVWPGQSSLFGPGSRLHLTCKVVFVLEGRLRLTLEVVFN